MKKILQSLKGFSKASLSIKSFDFFYPFNGDVFSTVGVSFLKCFISSQLNQNMTTSFQNAISVF